MPADPFHLAWFLQGSSIQAWGEPWTGNISDDWMSCDMFLDLARGCERACMDYMLLEDSIYVGETWQNSRDMYLKNGMSIPRQEPTVVATLMAAATTRLGIVPTLSTFAYAPYLVARIVGTLDQVSGGRGGWNMVTGSSDLSAKNFGMEQPAAARPALRHGGRIHRDLQAALGLVGTWCDRRRPPERRADRSGEGAHDRLRGRAITAAADR